MKEVKILKNGCGVKIYQLGGYKLNEEEKKKFRNIKMRLKKSTKYVLFVDKQDIDFLINLIEEKLKNEK